MSDVRGAIVQATLCFSSIAALRAAILYLDTKVGAILTGMPIVMFPILAIQAWYGPAITQSQTVGSIGSMTAVTGALWILRGRGSPTPLSALGIVALTWLAAVMIIHLLSVPAEIMTAIIAANALVIFKLHWNYHQIGTRTTGRFTDGLVPIVTFLVVFFMTSEFMPEFMRGVFVSFPIGLLATIHFARRVLTHESFRSFVIYTQGAITAGSVFVILVHFTLVYVPIGVSLAIALIGSLLTSILAIGIWRAPRPTG